MEATKNIYCMKSKGAVDHSPVTRWFKKFCLSCKNLDYQARSDMMHSEAMPQPMKTNSASSIQRI